MSGRAGPPIAQLVARGARFRAGASFTAGIRPLQHCGVNGARSTPGASRGQARIGAAMRQAVAVSFRPMSSAAGVDEQLRDLADKFGEARMELEDCHDSIGTTYFNDDCELCKELVAEVLSDYGNVLAAASPDEAKSIKQSWGLKLEQLKGELHHLLEAAGEDH